MNGRCHVNPGQPVRYSSLSDEPLTDWCLSGYLNSRPLSMKVTRVASNVLVEQTMSWEQDGGEQLQGRTASSLSKTATHRTPAVHPFVLLRVCVRSTCQVCHIWNREVSMCVFVWLRMSSFLTSQRDRTAVMSYINSCVTLFCR